MSTGFWQGFLPVEAQAAWLDTLIFGLLVSGLVIITVKVLLLDEAIKLSDVLRIIRGRNFSRGDDLEEQTRIAIATYSRYNELAQAEVQKMQRSYLKMSRAHSRYGQELGYKTKLGRLSQTNEANSIIANRIARLGSSQQLSYTPSILMSADSNDLSKVRESFKHFMRDWSNEGAQEREVIFRPILSALREILEEHGVQRTEEIDVLVPGSGLGRMAWEVHQMGFNTTAVEISPYMTLAFDFLLSPVSTTRPYQHTIHPHAYWFSHQRSNEALFRPITFPDTLPRLSDTFHVLAEDFLRMKRPERILGDGSTKLGYDVIITLFFIDTSLNVIATLEHIHELLRPGGRWINLGPLLWTGGAQASVELSLDEVLRLARLIGFDIDDESQKSIDCEYTADNAAMMRWIYQAEFWVARRR